MRALPTDLLDRWTAYRVRRRAEIAAGQRTLGAAADLAVPPPEPTTAVNSAGEPVPGVPLLRQTPFAIGFVGALGALTAVTLWGAIGQLTLTMTLLVVAGFLTLALDPLVNRLAALGLRRGWGVAVVFLLLVLVAGLLGLLVVPPVVDQATALVQRAPDAVNRLLDTPWVQRVDRDYHISDEIRSQVDAHLRDQGFLSSVAGGVLGAGQAAVNAIFQTFTVLVLTLYFLASLPAVKHAAYAVVPASRRARVIALSEEIMRRVGAYALGQVAVAAINGGLSFVALTVLDVPYAAVLAVCVSFLGLIPMVGATLGGALVTVAGLFQSPQTAVVLLVYYVVYQQVENYVIVPRIMARTVSVPGAVTVVAALAGGTLLGVLGALLAIPFAAGLLLLYEEVLVPRQRTR